jgi:two-component system LytT family response regulator
MRTKALIVDDEHLARRSVRRCLRSHPEVEVVGESRDGEAAITDVLTLKPDLVFLDVQMPEMDGFQVIHAVGVDRMPTTIFVTAHDNYALHAFDSNATDYLLKPFSQERFDQALARAQERISARLHAARKLSELMRAVQLDTTFPERLPVPVNGRIILIHIKDIDWIEQEGNYARLHLGAPTISGRR